MKSYYYETFSCEIQSDEICSDYEAWENLSGWEDSDEEYER